MEIVRKLESGQQRIGDSPTDLASQAASTPDTTGQCMDNEEPPVDPTWKHQRSSEGNPNSSTPTSIPQTQYLVPGLNATESSLNPFVPICVTLPSQEIHHVVSVLHRIKVSTFDTFLVFRISLPDTCLSSIKRQILRGGPILMNCLLYYLTDFAYSPDSEDLVETRKEVRSILVDGIRPFAAALLSSVPTSNPETRLLKLTSLLGMQVLLRTG
ncbi:hypothetical protein K469DRAFT_711824 [Zopfia rhizophila CBS 207.26]|uniref:Uncharacterized protein n=1 Tax=Zopfia rhizophila CBS 207.26 TaxID=1314779 RepID=A0A6A6DSR2_9PEZI|nr:hypothetical protein K469DRAFT_711824 [Zopfia rhizophila CBS 207.26]